MPIIAESEPIILGEAEEPIIPPVPPVVPGVIIIKPGYCNLSDMLANHKIFIEHVDMLGACFKREEMPEFTNQNFDLHSNIALVDKYITKNGEMFCSMQAVNNLSHKLKRFKD